MHELRQCSASNPEVPILAWSVLLVEPSKLKRKMPPGAFGELAAAAPQFPTWLAQAIGKAAYG